MNGNRQGQTVVDIGPWVTDCYCIRVGSPRLRYQSLGLICKGFSKIEGLVVAWQVPPGSLALKPHTHCRRQLAQRPLL